MDLCPRCAGRKETGKKRKESKKTFCEFVSLKKTAIELHDELNDIKNECPEGLKDKKSPSGYGARRCDFCHEWYLPSGTGSWFACPTCRPTVLDSRRIKNATALKSDLREAQVRACFFCNDPLVKTLDGTRNEHLEHIVAWARGGASKEYNLFLACAACNNSFKKMLKDNAHALLDTLTESGEIPPHEARTKKEIIELSQAHEINVLLEIWREEGYTLPEIIRSNAWGRDDTIISQFLGRRGLLSVPLTDLS